VTVQKLVNETGGKLGRETGDTKHIYPIFKNWGQFFLTPVTAHPFTKTGDTSTSLPIYPVF